MQEKFRKCEASRDIPQKISFAVFDIDGTIRHITSLKKSPKADQKVLDKMIEMAKKGVNIAVISGCSLSQMNDRFADLIKRSDFPELSKKFKFYGELGLVECDLLNNKSFLKKEFLNHEILNPQIRDKINDFFSQKEKQNHWSEIVLEPRAKEMMLNFSVSGLKGLEFQESDFLKVFKDFKNFLAQEKIDFVYPIKGPNFIDITLKLADGSFWDKDDAIGNAICVWEKEFDIPKKDIEDHCIVFGDSLSDLKMACPKYSDFSIGDIAFAFVGDIAFFLPDARQEKNIVLRSEGSYLQGGDWGPDITAKMLDFLMSKFEPFI